MRLQLEFFKKFLLNPDVNLYLIERKNKYFQQETCIPPFTTTPTYFKEWLAGFIEAEGSFSSRIQGNYSFSIAQNHDYYLITAIRNFYSVNHLTISNKKNKISLKPIYEISVGSKQETLRVIEHCKPLLQGYKYYQLAELVYRSKVFQDKVKEFFY